MTDKLPPLVTHLVSPSQTTSSSPKPTPTLPAHDVSSKVETLEEEPYTIKCICGFSDDDGNTIYCETCDTWQHIECFYPHNTQDAYREDFAHSCADCKPRPLDRQRAFDRQSQRQSRQKDTAADAPERNKKRPPSSKSHKKKAKPELHLNGQSGSDTNNTKHASEQTPTHSHKKSKSTHRPSQSISSSQNPKRSPSYGQKNGNPHCHPPSPATTPPDVHSEPDVHSYSSGFMSLYKDDNDISVVQTNSFVSLIISNVLSIWLRDHGKLKQETGCDFDEVFQTLPSNIDSIKKTPVVEHKELPIAPDTVLHWQYLSAPHAIEKDVPLIELNGQIGIQKDYCDDPENRWPELSSPLPFVFFHPMLPIYIDTRKEGSRARYVRRSCKPNAVVDTYLSGGSEYHFWLVSDRKIAPNEQITIPWDFRLPKTDMLRMLQLLGLGDEESNPLPEFDPNEVDKYQTIASWIYTILSEYGGCACDLGDGCAFYRFHRTYINRSQPKANGTRKKSRKPKANNISPTSTGHATNSRAPSEGQGDDGADDSGSSRSKPPSRDLTPAQQGSFDTLGVLTELTDREKRKVQMVEDTFRRMEQQQPPRKKKRTSDGTSSSTGNPKQKSRNSTSQASGVPAGSERRYVDVGTSRRSLSGSPGGVVSPNLANGAVGSSYRRSVQGTRPEYCDAAAQTDPVEGEWYSSAQPIPKPRKRVVSLSKRLLENRYRQRADTEERRRLLAASPTSVVSAMVKMDLDSPTLEDAPVAVSPVAEVEKKPPSPGVIDISDHPPNGLRGASTSEMKVVSKPAEDTVTKHKSPDLRVQLPPVPSFEDPISAISSATTPSSATGTLVQSPFSASNLPSPFAPPAVNGVAAHPSPVKKKLSLSDYTKSRLNKSVAAKPTGTTLKPASAILEEVKSPLNTDTMMLDSPIAEKNAT
jgi:hypothetical protein